MEILVDLFESFSTKNLTGDDAVIANDLQRQEYMYSNDYKDYLEYRDAQIERERAARRIKSLERREIERFAKKEYNRQYAGFVIRKYDWHNDYLYKIPGLRYDPHIFKFNQNQLANNKIIRYNETNKG